MAGRYFACQNFTIHNYNFINIRYKIKCLSPIQKKNNSYKKIMRSRILFNQPYN